jgi:two-component system CheB/CheR fusion protein
MARKRAPVASGVSGASKSKRAAGKKKATSPEKKSATARKAPSRKTQAESREEPRASESPRSQGVGFPVVGIGASAGGLEAFTELLEHLPSDTGMAFVFAQHLDPRHKSNLAQILSRSTPMPIREATDGMQLARNQIHVMPPDRDMAVFHGALSLMPRPTDKSRHMAIDYFLHSLVQDQGANAIGVILSGTASDGARGLQAIKAAGGIALVQDVESARYDGMPRSAIAAGDVDFVLPPKDIAAELARIGRHPHLERGRSVQAEGDMAKAPEALQKIFVLLRSATGVDFANYKQTTVQRRISRRLVLNEIEDLEHYVRLLQENPTEAAALFEDLLINVTEFFRDEGVFDALKKTVFPRLLKSKPANDPIRVWVPGCSTGEEAYSVTICLLEYLGEKELNHRVQIFATDISDLAIERARAGSYLEGVAADVSPERLRRFFIRSDSGYQIRKSIRDLCIFAKHNITKDPPFSRLDLISCRNLLIYLEPRLQNVVVPVFHYALKPSGFLLLGTSETIGRFSDLFSLADSKHKIYTKKSAIARLPIETAALPFAPNVETSARRARGGGWSREDLQAAADRIVLARYGPSGVVVNDDMEVLQFRGQTGRYLEPAAGEASFNLLKMARPGLLPQVRAAIRKANRENQSVRKEGLTVQRNGELLDLAIEVTLLKAPEDVGRHFLVLFEEVASQQGAALKGVRPRRGQSKRSPKGAEELAHLKNELASSTESLQVALEEHEAATEELRAANQETQASNEELQSTNEELETTKEELQSANEELTTLNEELENRNAELRHVVDDLNNLMNSAQIPTLMVDNDLRIRSYTPQTERPLRVIAGDIGRPIGELKLGVQVERLEEKILGVIKTLIPLEEAVQAHDGRWYSMRICPYRTGDNKIDGAVLVLVDITERQQAMQAVVETRTYVESIVDTVHESLVVLDADLRVVSAGRSFYRTFKVAPEETEGRLFCELGNHQWNIPALRKLLEEILTEHAAIEGFEVEHDFPGIGKKRMLLNARRMERPEGEPPLILLAMEDVRHVRH